jgi:L-iditol 2-dehydrogenase
LLKGVGCIIQSRLGNMKAAVLHRPGEMSIEDLDEPVCPEGGAVIRVDACAVCPTDIKMARVGQRDLSYPRVLGHEVVGVVEGNESPDLEEGDRVQVWPGIACGRCPSCLRGQDNLCSSQGIIGFNRDGGFAERMAVPRETIAQGGANLVPAGMDPAVATLTEPLACCVHGQKAASVAEDDRMVIFGSGPMGLMHAALKARNGYGAMVIEPDQERREIARRMGAERVVDPFEEGVGAAVIDWTSGRGADVAILATPKVRVDDHLLRIMAPRGRICAFSGLPRDDPRVSVDINAVHYRELTVVGAYGCSSSSNAEALAILVKGEVNLAPLISKRMPLGGIEIAFALIEQRRALKCVIDDLTR